MRALSVALLLLASVAVVGAPFEVPPASGEDEIEGVTWLTELDAARAEARKTGRPILAVFR